MEAALKQSWLWKKSQSGPRILIVRVGAMGDVLHGMPAVAALREKLPDAHIGWAVEPRWAPLLRSGSNAMPRSSGMPLVDGVHPVPAREWSKQPFSRATVENVLALRRELRDQAYDVAIDLQGSIRSAVIARMSGARQVVGRADPREWPARHVYWDRVHVISTHVIDQAAEIVSEAIGGKLLATAARLPVDSRAEAWCDALVFGQRAPVVFLAPTAGWGAKQWPAERFGALATELVRHGYRVLVNASPAGGDAVADAVVRFSGNTAEAVACTLPQLIALLRRVHLVIAGDSGPLHLASTLGKPAVALFGPTDPARTGPHGGAFTVLRHASSVTDHRRHTVTEAGLAKIGVDEVLAASLGQLHGRETKGMDND